MKSFPARTLSGQLVSVMLVAVAISQLVTLLIYRGERDQALRVVLQEECMGRVASVFRLTRSTPASQRPELLETVGTPLTRFWLSLAPPASAPDWQQIAREHLMRPAQAMDPQVVPTSIFAKVDTLDRLSTAAWKILPQDASHLRVPVHIIELRAWNGFGFALPLEDGSWMNTVYAKPDYLVRTTITPGYYLALGLTIIILSLAAWMTARRISRPLRHLTKAAERLGRGEELELLPEEGPDDIRLTLSAFNRMQIRLRRFVEDRTRMLGAIGHDLRTPITTLRLRAEFVADPETREKMVATLDEMQAMTEAALSFARSEATVEPSRVVDLSALVESLCDDLMELGWTIDFQGNGRLPCTCRPDSARRAIRNVIENAVRYGERARVTVVPHPEDIEIQVEDDGPGIPEEDRERVFAPFVRLESSRNQSTGGVGLGLSIARSIMRSHGGDVTFSDSGAGLKVILRLPREG